MRYNRTHRCVGSSIQFYVRGRTVDVNVGKHIVNQYCIQLYVFRGVLHPFRIFFLTIVTLKVSRIIPPAPGIFIFLLRSVSKRLKFDWFATVAVFMWIGTLRDSRGRSKTDRNSIGKRNKVTNFHENNAFAEWINRSALLHCSNNNTPMGRWRGDENARAFDPAEKHPRNAHQIAR